MGSEKNKELKKRVLDALKDELQPLTDAEGATLAGGFASGSGSDTELGDISANVPCNTKNTGCNMVAGCGGKTTAPASS